MPSPSACTGCPSERRCSAIITGSRPPPAISPIAVGGGGGSARMDRPALKEDSQLLPGPRNRYRFRESGESNPIAARVEKFLS